MSQVEPWQIDIIRCKSTNFPCNGSNFLAKKCSLGVIFYLKSMILRTKATEAVQCGEGIKIPGSSREDEPGMDIVRILSHEGMH